MSVKSVFNVLHCRLPAVAMGTALLVAGLAFGQLPNKPVPADPVPAKPPESPHLFPQGLPRMEQFLTIALDRHPEVVVARSKVEGARAELLRAEAAALKELMQLHLRAKNKRALVDRLRQQNAQGRPGIEDLQTEASDLSLLEWEIALAQGFQVPGKPSTELSFDRASKDPKTEGSSDPVEFLDFAYPQPDFAAKVKTAMSKENEGDLSDSTLTDLCDFVAEITGVPVVIDENAIKNSGLDIEARQFNVMGNRRSVTALVQQIEDRHQPLYFVIRDYGILITTTDSAPIGAVGIRDFVQLTESELRDKLRAKQAAQAQQMREGRGGGGGGFF